MQPNEMNGVKECQGGEGEEGSGETEADDSLPVHRAHRQQPADSQKQRRGETRRMTLLE